MTRRYRIVLLAYALLGTSCFTPEATECPEGFFCPAGKYCAANQLVCIDENDLCGNGLDDGTEVCDDGNIIDGDGCSANCDSDETCGNDVVDDSVGEVCDDNNTEDDDGCSGDCKSNELCGNGITDTAVGEKCDDENTDGGDGCSASCLSDETCGNDFTDVLLDDPEFCDDGNNEDGDGCSADCKSGEGCGNGLIDEGEVCDGDGAGTGGETATCDDDCTPVTCGDGHVNATANEMCDGNGLGVGGETAACNVDCTPQMCGDSKLNTTASEQCDQGPVSTSGCDSNCTFPSCNDGIFNDPAEICDDGMDTVACDVDCTLPACNDGHFNDPAEVCDTGGNTLTCDVDCTLPGCNDGIFNDPAEICDTGGDSLGCDVDCTLPACNDGHFNDPAEICDTGGNSVTCDSDCTAPACNDGIFNDPAEICDTGGDTVACDDDCTLPSCGDGHFNDPAEICDTGVDTVACDANDCTLPACNDGHFNDPAEICDTGGNSATCDSDCTAPACNDGIFNDPAEICDTGGDSVACDSDCTLPACGDGHFNDPAEVCDTGVDTVSCDAFDCSAPACNDGHFNDPAEVCDTGGDSATCDSDCTAVACGDDHINTEADEECDDGDTANNDNCVFALGCKNNICGDGWRDQESPQTEACDGNNDGTGGGTNVATCDTDCTAPACNDGIFNDPAEICDTNGDSASCDDDCTLPACGDNNLNIPAGEECDDGDTSDNDNCVFSLGCKTNVCGDTFRDQEGGQQEACDDGNNDACGTCNLGCTTAQATPTAATGFIIFVTYAEIVDGETFIIDDGINPAITFEFDKNEGGDSDGSGTTLINIGGDVTAQDVRNDADAVFDGLDSTWNIDSTQSGSTRVNLTNELATGLGNNPIEEFVADDGFTISGMSGGKARDCLADVGCTVDNDCAQALGFTCQGTAPFKTCQLHCGNGVVDSGEACDDGNDLACGTCNDTCTASVAPTAATGSFTAVTKAELADTETFTIDDGINASATVFEFDFLNNGASVGGRVPVNVLTAITADDVAAAMRSAINGVGASLRVAAAGSGATVALTHDNQTSLGNQPLDDTVADTDFVHSGMSGGLAGDCEPGDGCTAEAVCEPDLTCDTVTDFVCE